MTQALSPKRPQRFIGASFYLLGLCASAPVRSTPPLRRPHHQTTRPQTSSCLARSACLRSLTLRVGHLRPTGAHSQPLPKGTPQADVCQFGFAVATKKPGYLAWLQVAVLWYHTAAGCCSCTWAQEASTVTNSFDLPGKTRRAEMTKPFVGCANEKFISLSLKIQTRYVYRHSCEGFRDA